MVPQEDADGGRSSFGGGSDGRVEQQDRIDFGVPKYTRDTLNLLTLVESGLSLIHI